MTKKITWVSAQNLIGGMAYGFEQEFGQPECIITGFAGNDALYIDYTNKTRNLNVPIVGMDPTYHDFVPTGYVCANEVQSTSNDIPYDADIWAMTPICSGLSMLNTVNDKNSTRARGDADNEQCQNMYNLTALAMRYRGKVIVFENAPALYTNSGKGVRDRLHQIAQDNGYTFQVIKTNTALHGIPQHRHRTFAVFYRDSNPGLFEFEDKGTIPFADYLAKTVKPDSTYNDFYYFGENLVDDELYNVLKTAYGVDDPVAEYQRRHSDAPHVSFGVMAIDAGLDKCINACAEDSAWPRLFRHIQEKHAQNKGWFDTTARVFFQDGINAIISKNMNILNTNTNKFLNVRELMTMMGLPQDLSPENMRAHIYKIPQTVPVCTANYVARQIKKYLNNELVISDSSHVLQNNEKQRTDLGGKDKSSVPSLFD